VNFECRILNAESGTEIIFSIQNLAFLKMNFDQLIEAKLREARENGEFNNLKREGNLNLEDDSSVPEEERIVQHILRQNNVAPDWIETDKALRQHIDQARAGLRRSYEWRRTKLLELPDPAERERIELQWKRAQKRFEDELEQINRQIFAFNLKTPASSTQRRPLRLAEELERAKRVKSE